MKNLTIFFTLLYFSNFLSASAEKYNHQAIQIDAVTVERYSSRTSGMASEENQIIELFIKKSKIDTTIPGTIVFVANKRIADIVRSNYPHRSIEHSFSAIIKNDRRVVYCFYQKK